MTETSTAPNLAPARGMRDLLPYETAIRDWATRVIVETYERFGFARIETPALEHLELLKSGEGGENLQLIFEVLKRGDKLERVLAQSGFDKNELSDLGLRFDLTVPLVRYFCQNQANLMYPFKAIQIGSVWRAESPQQGRFRQFTQCDIDVLGVKSEIAEMELLTASSRAMLNLGFENFKLRINDRRLLAALVESFAFKTGQEQIFIAIDKLDKIGIDGVRKEVSRVSGDEQLAGALVDALCDLEPKANGNADALERYKRLLDSHKGKSLKDATADAAFSAIPPLRKVIETVSASANGRFEVIFDPTLVRGMGYYTGQIFEISIEGYSYSMGGGGRYDKMVGKFSGRDVPACGYSIGFERIVGVLADRGFTVPEARPKLALIYEDRDDPALVMVAAQKLREQGFDVFVQPKKKDMNKQLDALVAQNFANWVGFRGDPDNLQIKEFKK